MRALFINGSPRGNGNTEALLSYVRKAFSENGFLMESICLGDKELSFCKGCKSCYTTGICNISDEVQNIITSIDKADFVIVAVPSYWGEMTGHMKVFIDRCTPYCNNRDVYTKLSSGKKGIALSIRAGEKSNVCEHIIGNIELFFKNIGIEPVGNYWISGVLMEKDLLDHQSDLDNAFAFATKIIGEYKKAAKDGSCQTMAEIQ